MHEGRGLAPLAREDKGFQGLADPRGHLALSQVLRQPRRVAGKAEDQRCHWLMAVWDTEQLACLIHVKPGHLMDCETEGSGLDHQVLDRQADVVKGVPIRLLVSLKGQPGHREHEDRRMLRPSDVAFDETAQQALVFTWVLFGRDDEAPGLLVEGRGRPSRRLQKTAELLGLDHPIGEGAWAPALPQQLVNRISGLSKFLHG